LYSSFSSFKGLLAAAAAAAAPALVRFLFFDLFVLLHIIFMLIFAAWCLFILVHYLLLHAICYDGIIVKMRKTIQYHQASAAVTGEVQ